MKRKFNLQLFAAGENQNQFIRTYNQQLLMILQSVFAVKSYWSDFFTNLQTLDGIAHKDVAFTIKTDDVAAAISVGSLEEGGTAAYDTGANVAFGTGTGSTSRFGQRTEVKYTDQDVPYTWDWVYHEGIDKHTVNEDFDAANAREMEKIAGGITGKFNAQQGKYLSDNAGKTVAVNLASADSITSAQAIAIFNEMDAYLTNQEVDETLTKVAAVTPALYNAITDNSLSTTAKGSSVNIDRNEVTMFKGFVIRKLPDNAFQSADAVDAVTGVYTVKIGGTVANGDKITVAGTQVTLDATSGASASAAASAVETALGSNANYTVSASGDTLTFTEKTGKEGTGAPAATITSTAGTVTVTTTTAGAAAQNPAKEICIAGVAQMGVPFTGIETARAFEAHDFDGTTLQGAGKAGQFISKDNQKALVKVKASITGA